MLFELVKLVAIAVMITPNAVSYNLPYFPRKAFFNSYAAKRQVLVLNG
jgi:hypothetical protein